jgi:hypothetical protein
MMFSPEFIIAAPPVGSSKAWDELLLQVMAYFSSVSAAFNKPPVLPMKPGSWPVRVPTEDIEARE